MNQSNANALDQEYRQKFPREALLADDLAATLNDPHSIAFYRRCAEGYREDYLRQLAAYVREMPDERIRRSRGALFTALLKHGWHQE